MCWIEFENNNSLFSPFILAQLTFQREFGTDKITFPTDNVKSNCLNYWVLPLNPIIIFLCVRISF